MQFATVAVADLNGDGRLDLVVANAGAGSVSVLLNQTAAGATTPSFTAQQTFTTGSFPYSVAVADVNGDGRPDLATANVNDGTVSVLLAYDLKLASRTTASWLRPARPFATGNWPRLPWRAGTTSTATAGPTSRSPTKHPAPWRFF